MKKLSTNNADNLILKFCVKVIISSVISILLFSYIAGKIVFAFDLDLELSKYISVAICVLCACVISFVSVNGFKNNGILLGLIAEMPLVFYSLVNLIFNGNYVLFFVIKTVLIILFGMLIGELTVRKSKKIKVSKWK